MSEPNSRQPTTTSLYLKSDSRSIPLFDRQSIRIDIYSTWPVSSSGRESHLYKLANDKVMERPSVVVVDWLREKGRKTIRIENVLAPTLSLCVCVCVEESAAVAG